MNLKKKILSAALVGGVLFSGGNFSVEAADDLTSFKEAYLAEVVDNRAFSMNADFFGPSYRTEINGRAKLLRDATMQMDGTMHWEFTDPSSYQVQSEDIPFYVSQNGDDMTMLVQRSGRWSKFALPAIPVGIANALKTTDIGTLQQNMSAVKSVEVLKDDADQRIMNVTLDGKKLAELVRTYNDAKLATLSQSEQTAQKDFIGHLTDALQTTDLTCSWTVSKKNWQTITASANLTKLIQAYGKDYLDDAAKGELVLSQTDRAFYEVLGYYSELHFVVNYYNDSNETVAAQPAGSNYAQTNANVFADLVKKISETKR